jgi:hypothetical protein
MLVEPCGPCLPRLRGCKARVCCITQSTSMASRLEGAADTLGWNPLLALAVDEAQET